MSIFRGCNRNRREFDEYRAELGGWCIPVFTLVAVCVAALYMIGLPSIYREWTGLAFWLYLATGFFSLPVFTYLVGVNYWGKNKPGFLGWYRRHWKNNIIGHVIVWYPGEHDDLEHQVVPRFQWKSAVRYHVVGREAVIMPLGGLLALTWLVIDGRKTLRHRIKRWADDVVTVYPYQADLVNKDQHEWPRDRITMHVRDLFMILKSDQVNVHLKHLGLVGMFQRQLNACQNELGKAQRDHDRYQRQVADDLHDEIKRVMSTHRFQYQKDGVNVLMCLIGDFKRLAPESDSRQAEHRATYKQLQVRLEELS